MINEEKAQSNAAMFQVSELTEQNAALRETLRDRFAMAALTGVVDEHIAYTHEKIAKQCYTYADAMMKERVKI